MAPMLQRDCKQIGADFVLQRSGSQLFLSLEKIPHPPSLTTSPHLKTSQV